ncbi:MAG: hypothetical protein ABJB12_19200 [Pseudomonadota bacterium]
MRPRLRLALLLLPLALMLAALLDTPFHLLWDGELVGILRSAVAPKFSVRSFWNGTYQTEFEAWLEQQLSPKALMVRSDNTLNLVLFREISAHTGVPIVLGKRHALFEMNYVNNLNAVSEFKGDPPPRTAYSVEESVRLMARAARAFQLIRMDFMVVFYPVKAVIWSDRVRPSFRLPGGAEKAAAGYASLLNRLRAAGVPVVDGAATFSEIAREKPNFPLYNSGGTHWTDAGACEVSKQVLGAMTHANITGVALRCRHGKSLPATGDDIDIASLINVWDDSWFMDPVPGVVPQLSAPLHGGPRNAWIVGTSYSDGLARELTQAGVFDKVKRSSYYRHSDVNKLDWKRLLNTHPVVIFEQWQWSYLTVNLTEFVDDLSTQSPRFAKALRQIDADDAASAAALAPPAPAVPVAPPSPPSPP